MLTIGNTQLPMSAFAGVVSAMANICIILMVVFAAVNIAFGEDFTTGVTASIACIGNVGPGFGDVGSMSNYSDFPAILKFTGMIEMLIGRLEIFPVLYLFRSIKKS